MRYAFAVLAIAIVAPLAAQTHSHGAQVAAPPEGSVATATGCLARSPDTKSFVLKHAAWQSANAPTGQAAPAPTRTQPSNIPPTTETLLLAGAASTLKLDAHVGHTITVTGTIAKRDPVVTPGVVLPDPQPQGDTTSRTKDAETRAAANLRTFDLRSMTHVAAECK
jgi:hypothetical protein